MVSCRGVAADPAVMPWLVGEAGLVFGASRVAHHEAVLPGVSRQPCALDALRGPVSEAAGPAGRGEVDRRAELMLGMARASGPQHGTRHADARDPAVEGQRLAVV